MVESTRLESEHTGNRIVGSNPTLSAIESIPVYLVAPESPAFGAEEKLFTRTCFQKFSPIITQGAGNDCLILTT